MATSPSMLINYVVAAWGPYMYTNTSTGNLSHIHVRGHTHTHVAGAHPSTSPSHRVIFTQALSPLIGADEGLIGSFFTTRST